MTGTRGASPRPRRLASVLDVEPDSLPVGGACKGQPDRLFHPSPGQGGGVAVHICLSHCTVREVCRRYAAKYRWHGTVIAGQYWVTRNGRPTPSPMDARSTGCPICRQTAKARPLAERI